MTTLATSARGAVRLSSQAYVSTSPATASQMPRYGAEPKQVPAISKAQAGGQCVTRRTLMNIAVNSAALVAAPISASAYKDSDDTVLLDLVAQFWAADERATEYDEQIEPLFDVWNTEWARLRDERDAGTSSLSQKEIFEMVKQLPESREHNRLVKLTQPHHDEAARLLRKIWEMPTSTIKGRSEKFNILISYIWPHDWLKPDGIPDMEVQMTRDLLCEMIGGKESESWRQIFKRPEAA
jgi:hypothetical protein